MIRGRAPEQRCIGARALTGVETSKELVAGDGQIFHQARSHFPSHNVRCAERSRAKGAEKRGFVPQIEGGESLLTLPYLEPGEPPQVRLWHAEELGADWRPPLCTGWGEKRFDQPGCACRRFARLGRR